MSDAPKPSEGKRMSVLEQLKKLNAEEARIATEKSKLRDQAKDEMVKAINDQITELNGLGFKYKLAGGPAKKRAPKTCSNCGRQGHTARTCPEPKKKAAKA